MQDMVWMISLALMGIVALAFMYVAAGAARPGGDTASIVRAAYAWRGRLFWTVLIAGAAISLATLWQWPIAGHAKAAAKPDVVIRAMGRQWSWQLDRDTVQVGQLVEFEVTATDVNHGFALYRDKAHLIAQAQAMPGYVNKLQVRFTEPGDYEVLCLEYCGVGHHIMRAVLKVRDS